MKTEFEYEQEIKGLREELVEDRQDILDLGAECNRLNGRLTAAEQRNAELVELLREVWRTMGHYFPGDNPPAHEALMSRLDATLKPTESGGKLMSSKLDRRKARIEEELRRDRERRAFEMSQPKGPSRRICIADIPYTKFEG